MSSIYFELKQSKSTWKMRTTNGKDYCCGERWLTLRHIIDCIHTFISIKGFHVLLRCLQFPSTWGLLVPCSILTCVIMLSMGQHSKKPGDQIKLFGKGVCWGSWAKPVTQGPSNTAMLSVKNERCIYSQTQIRRRSNISWNYINWSTLKTQEKRRHDLFLWGLFSK